MNIKIEYKIAIIMPVHNTPQKYLQAALVSLNRQIFKNYRLICVDDKSTDIQTIQTLQEWNIKHENIDVIYLNEAVGAAEARNIGLKTVNEEYVIFLDSDDIFEEDFLLKMYEQITSSKAQVCVCGWKKISDNHEIMSTWTPYKYENKKDELFLVYEHLVPWNKLCQRKLLIENNIHFQNLKSSNDLYYSMCVLFETKNICYIEEPLIKYRMFTEHQISANREPMNLAYACKCAMERYSGKTNSNRRIQILILMIMAMRAECKDEHTYSRLCEYIKYNMLDNIILDDIENKTIKKIILLIKENEYTLHRAEKIFLFENQIKDHEAELINELQSYENIFLWGIGKRGKAFLKFCHKRNIKISAVTDSNSLNMRKEDCLGNKLIDINDMLNKKGVIIASNNSIFHCISKMKTESGILNLQHYCPFSDIM